jgi:hypothetical protein
MKLRSSRTLTIVSVLVLLFVGSLAGAYYLLGQSGATLGLDNKFGDQNLKTAVALIELHKVRYGKYPDSLKVLKFVGNWDRIALNSVVYVPNSDRSAYFVEVTRGWVGKPQLQMPDEFWHGTGYQPALRPAN